MKAALKKPILSLLEGLFACHLQMTCIVVLEIVVQEQQFLLFLNKLRVN